MKNIDIHVKIESLDYSELNPDEQRIIEAAKATTAQSYAPYSHFRVGAAVLLDNGEIVCGSNQENAAYPSGLCAERTAIFYANSQYPESAVVMLAIAAHTAGTFLPKPITPCGACRQVLLEAEERFHRPIEVLLYGTQTIYRIGNIHDLLPLSFSFE